MIFDAYHPPPSSGHRRLNGGGVVVDEATMVAARDRLFFERLEPITVKGKKNVCKIFQPYPNRCVERDMRGG